MGNCNKKDENNTVTSFEDERWKEVPTAIHPSCTILENIYHPNIRLMKWIASAPSPVLAAEPNPNTQLIFTPLIYETGQTRRYSDMPNYRNSASSIEKRTYLITEELVRVKDMELTEEEAIVILHEALAGYEFLLSQHGGFVAREDMIFVSREGAIRLWISENIAEATPQFPHPHISDEQFITSLITQICSHASGAMGLQKYLLSDEISFSHLKGVLSNLIWMRRSKLKVDIEKTTFENIFKGYKSAPDPLIGSKVSSSSKPGGLKARNNSLDQIRFMVSSERDPNSHKKTGYVRDYSRVLVPFSSRQNEPSRAREQEGQWFSQSSYNGGQGGERTPLSLSRFRMNRDIE